jgi:hypothetical protein
MLKYDQPGFHSPLVVPGDFDRAMTAPGSQGAVPVNPYAIGENPPVRGPNYGEIIATHDGQSTQVGRHDTVQVGIGDTVGTSDRLPVHAIPHFAVDAAWTDTGAGEGRARQYGAG